MTDEDDDDEDLDPDVFTLSGEALRVLKGLELPIRDRLYRADPQLLRHAAAAILALRRLPRVTPGVSVRVGWQTPAFDGSYQWADVVISEEEIAATVGSREPGDTGTDQLFLAFAGGRSEGSIAAWVEARRALGDDARLTVHDEWAADEDIPWAHDRPEVEDDE